MARYKNILLTTGSTNRPCDRIIILYRRQRWATKSVCGLIAFPAYYLFKEHLLLAEAIKRLPFSISNGAEFVQQYLGTDIYRLQYFVWFWWLNEIFDTIETLSVGEREFCGR